MTIKIEVPDMNDSVSRVTLANKEFLIRFTWNDTYRYWSYGLYDTEHKPILHACKIVPFSPLNHFYALKNMPNGIFGCVTNQESVGRNDFKDGVAEFIFIPKSDLEGWEVGDAYEQ